MLEGGSRDSMEFHAFQIFSRSFRVSKLSEDFMEFPWQFYCCFKFRGIPGFSEMLQDLSGRFRVFSAELKEYFKEP